MSNDCNTYLRLTPIHASIEQPLLTQNVQQFARDTNDKKDDIEERLGWILLVSMIQSGKSIMRIIK